MKRSLMLSSAALILGFLPSGRVEAEGDPAQGFPRLSPELYDHVYAWRDTELTPDGKILVAGRADGALVLFETATGKRLLDLERGLDPQLVLQSQLISDPLFTLSPDGKLLASTRRCEDIKLWDIPGGNPRATLPCRAVCFGELVFSSDGKLLAARGLPRKGEVRARGAEQIALWETESGKEVARLKGGPYSPFASIVFSPDGRILAAATEKKTAELWSTASGKRLAEVKGDLIRFSPDWKRLLARIDREGLAVLEAAAGRTVPPEAQAPTDEAPRGPALLRSTRPGVPLEETVGSRLCHAGRYRVEKVDATDPKVVHLKLLERVASGDGHPNASGPEDVTALLEWEASPVLRPGDVYCLVLTHGSMTGLTVEGYGNADPQTFEELKKLMQSRNAFENDAASGKRRALWASFRKDVEPHRRVAIYCENDDLDRMLYLPGSNAEVYLYDMKTHKAEALLLQKRLPQINRITFEDGGFLLWSDGVIEQCIR